MKIKRPLIVINALLVIARNVILMGYAKFVLILLYSLLFAIKKRVDFSFLILMILLLSKFLRNAILDAKPVKPVLIIVLVVNQELIEILLIITVNVWKVIMILKEFLKNV